MTKRPLCMFALLLAALIRILGMAGVPAFGISPPVLPEGCSPKRAVAEGRVYQQESNSFYTILYIRDANLITNSEKQPIEQIKVNIKTNTLKDMVRPGMKVRLTGSLKEIPLPNNPGQFHERSYYYARNVKWYLEASGLSVLDPAPFAPERIRGEIREKLKEKILALAPGSTGGILCAMILGDKGEIERSDKLILQLCGISHMIAISGTHLSVLGWGLYRILRKCRVPVAWAGVISVAVMVQYGIFTGGGASVIRAVIMVALSAGALAAGRTYDMLSALSLAAVLLLLESPCYLYDSGFLLSFSALLGIAVFYPFLQKDKGRVLRALEGGCAIQAAMLPVQLHFFFEIPVFGILINLMVLPAIGIILFLGILGSLAGFLSFSLGKLFLFPAVLLLEIFLKGGRLVQQIPFASVITGCPAMWKNVVYYGIFLLWILGGRKRGISGKEKKKQKINFTVVFIIASAFLIFSPQGKGVRVTFLDVGQGDCAVVQSREGVYLIDGGSSSVKGVGIYRILPFLKWSGISTVDGIFLSHMDEDHVNGIKEILEACAAKETVLRVRRLYLSACEEKEQVLGEIEKLAARAGCQIVYIRQGDEVRRGDLTVQCLYPGNGKDGGSNENSQVLYLTCGRFRGLFTGDMEGAGEKEAARWMRESGVRAEILKVAHHGSAKSTSSVFLEAVGAAAGIISCSQDNSYGHPHPELLKRLEQADVKYFTTAQFGAVTVEAKGKKLKLSFQFKENMVN